MIEPGGATAVAEPEAEAILFTENLTKQFGTHYAVRDLNIEVERGSITGIVGPNGAGKTTTFLMLATLLEPTSGAAFVAGHDPVLEPREVRRKLGYMPDFFGIYDDLRVEEYLDFFGHTYRVPASKRPRLVDDLLELVDLTVKRNAFVDTLSRGMKQRLGLARALVHDPEILILDEPASGLDPRARVELRALLQELRRMGKTIVISSHILSELEDVCSHIIILEAGRVIAQGTGAEIATGLAVARRVRVRSVAEDLDALRAALEANPAVSGVEESGGVIEAELAGGEAEAAALLAGLIAGGVRVTGFSEVETGLEEIFMRVTKGVVQ